MQAVFGGDSGHRDEVLSVCVHSLGNCLLSAGMDHSIKIWALDNEDVARAVDGKHTDDPALTAFQEGPVFSTYRVHSVSE
jgi:polycomb protein EED